nr:centrosomal protein of 131 kDa [Onthophagus taurus]XP_022903447.1 centrosomal protein of 131 kDa [Onthophagus taurus]
MSGTNRANPGDNFDLKLFGDKVKLEVRTINKPTSRCALLSRPSSAIPALNLYSKQEDFDLKIKRPFSAGCIQHKSMESLCNEDPSAQLCASEAKFEKNQDFESYNCLLKPGLTTKPPLPKKSEQNQKLDDEIEIIRLKSLQFDKEFNEAYKTSKDIMSEKEFENYLEKSSYFKIEEKNAAKNEKKTDGFLKNLKIKQVEIDKCINKAQKVLEKSLPKSNKDSKLNSQMKVDNWLNDKTKTETNKTNYFEILDKVEDLDFVTRVEDEMLKEIPEHDKEDVSDSNTYDDIVQILEVLEEEDRKSHRNIESMKEILDLKQKDVPIIKITEASRASSATSHSSDQGLGSTASLISNSSNYTEILSYLDEVDKTCTKSLKVAKEKVQKVTKALEGTVVFSTIPKKEDLIQLTIEELSEQIIDLHLRVKDKSSSIKLLQDELSSLRDQVLKITKQTETIVREKLKSQKEEHENIVKRHQKFIDQLIADKKALNQQCEGLINEMKMLEDRYSSNMKAAEHKHQVEMKKAKEMHLAGEKIRRERWIEGKTQKIKELTVKSIEPELQSMTLRHERELSDLRALHKKEIEDLEMKSARKTQQLLENLREQLGEEREKAVANEREIMNQRYQKLIENEEKNYQEQRRRLQQEHSKKMLECEEKEAMITTEKEKTIKLIQEDFDEKLNASKRKHNNELKLLKETTEMELEAWKNNYRKQQTVQLLEKETKMREQFKKERDREIEEVIERLEAETNENRQQIEITTENRIRRMREKFENEIKELEKSENEVKLKYGQTKTKLLEYEDVVIHLKGSIKQIENQLSVSQEISAKLTEEKENMKEIVRKEMNEDLKELENEVNRLKSEKDKELNQVYSRVKIAIAKKDEMLQELSRDFTSIQEKCVYLENMLEQQRKEYLIK